MLVENPPRTLYMRVLRVHPKNLDKPTTTKAEVDTRKQTSCSITNKRREVEKNVQACTTPAVLTLH